MVTSKPDLYPLVISYNAEPVTKSNSGSTGYLMVQYFRNFIVRPVGSLSATSTIDSLSSSFLCNAANEANNIIPPPYSHMGSLDEISTENQFHIQTPQQHQEGRLPRSSSTNSNIEYHQVLHTSPSSHTHLGLASLVPPTPIHQRPASPRQQVVSIRDNPCFDQNTTNFVNITNPTMPNDITRTGRVENKCQSICDAQVATPAKLTRRPMKPKFSKEDSESQDDEHNFSDLLNLSVCVPSNVIHCDNPIQTSPQSHEFYSVTNSIGSDISSLANLGSPDSPPRATSPTVEMRELLGKIQQLPQQRSPVPPQHQPEQKIGRNYFHKIKAKTLYMPLCHENVPVRTNKVSSVFSRSWTSRSAPCTPCGNFVPSFSTHHKGSQKGSKSRLTDGSPLLKEQAEESGDESNVKDEHL